MMVDRMTRVLLFVLSAFLGVTAIIGAVSVVPTLPREWLSGTFFPDFTVPASALGMIGIGALVAAALLVWHVDLGVRLSIAVGAAIAIFEIVETAALGFDTWLHALGLGPPPKLLPGAADVGTVLGVPTPLWLQPFYFIVGLMLVALGLRLYAHTARKDHSTGPWPAHELASIVAGDGIARAGRGS